MFEAIHAHKAYAADKPWMTKPRPICVDVAELESLLADRDAALRCVMKLEMQSNAIYGVRRYCAEVQENGTQSERAIAQTVSRMLAESPMPSWQTPVVHDCGEEPIT